jgi:hypothetical protein
MRNVELVSWKEVRARLSEAVRDSFPEGRKLRVIEAGCGRKWGLDVDPDACSITGIDLDATAMKVRIETHGDIHHAIVGDVQDPAIVEAGSADLVYASFVLEHLPKAEEAADAWATWLDGEGMIIALVPDARSVYGYASSRTPFGFHIWAHRYLLGYRDAGKPGHAPYPVSYSRLMTMDGLERFAADHGMEVVSLYAIGEMQSGTHRVGGRKLRMVEFGKRTVSRLSGGRLSWRHDNIAVVMKKTSFRKSRQGPNIPAVT